MDNQVIGADKKNNKNLAIDLPSLANELNNTSRRVRIMEERYINLRNKIQVSDENVLGFNRRVNAKLRDVNEELTLLRRQVNEVKDKILLIIKELQSTAKKDKLLEIQKYIDMWSPLSFVTKNEVSRIVKEEVKAALSGEDTAEEDTLNKVPNKKLYKEDSSLNK